MPNVRILIIVDNDQHNEITPHTNTDSIAKQNGITPDSQMYDDFEYEDEKLIKEPPKNEKNDNKITENPDEDINDIKKNIADEFIPSDSEEDLFNET